MRAFSFLLAVAIVALAAAPAMAARSGGPCSYQDFPGKVSVIAVTPVPQPQSLPDRLPYQPHKVVFVFTPSVSVPHGLHTPGKTYELTLSDGAPAGPEFLKKYHIRPGATFKTDLHLITSGTCSPVVFTFHGIDVYDHFELKK